MNWAKGRATKGRGSSFKGALQYVLHDKDAGTTERVGFVELRNLATDDPGKAWREMMTLCDAADDLKQRAGVATGRKLTKPVYAFTLNWHEDDRPDPAHMRDTAESALEALGMDHLQAVIVEHTDRPHRHVHVIVNLVDPDTGKAVSLSNDEHKLDRWADTYEVVQGVIRSPDRRAKFHALDNERKPPKRPAQAKSREEWEATRKLTSQQARERAAEIRAAYAERAAALSAAQGKAYERRRAEAEGLWKGYKADRKLIRDRYQPFIDAIYKSRRKAPPHPHTEQALRDLEESAEWKEFGRQQFKQRRLFNARESSLLGAIGNAVRLHYANRTAPRTSGLFKLIFSHRARQQQFQRQLEGQKQDLRKRQALRRKDRADTLRASCRLELSRLSENFQKRHAEMQARQAAEIAAQKAEWRQLAAERAKAWSDYRKTFEMVEPAQAQERDTHREFNDAATGRRPHSDKPNQERAAPSTEPKKRDWRARRSAAERKADGSYKARDRGRDNEPPGRSRQRDRYDHD